MWQDLVKAGVAQEVGKSARDGIKYYCFYEVVNKGASIVQDYNDSNNNNKPPQV